MRLLLAAQLLLHLMLDLQPVAMCPRGICPICLQDGVEEYNTLDHNLAAFVHVIGQVSGHATSAGQGAPCQQCAE